MKIQSQNKLVTLPLKAGLSVMISLMVLQTTLSIGGSTKASTHQLLNQSLLDAAEDGELSIIKGTLAHHAFIDTQGRLQMSALHLTALKNHGECLDYLLKKEASKELRDVHGWTALHLAVISGNDGCVDLLLQAGADREALDNDGHTPLHHAACTGNIPCITLLLNAKVTIDPRNPRKKTPLHFAADNGRKDAIKLLIAYGAEINAQNENLLTPLHFASAGEHIECVELLAELGCNRFVLDRCGRFAWEIAPHESRAQIHALLINYCSSCSKKLPCRICSRCKCATYCSSLCQKNDWEKHKAHCKSLPSK